MQLDLGKTHTDTGSVETHVPCLDWVQPAPKTPQLSGSERTQFTRITSKSDLCDNSTQIDAEQIGIKKHS